MTAAASKRSIGIRKAGREIRKFVATANAMLMAGDKARAYQYAEAAQMAAFDFKALVAGDLDEYTSNEPEPLPVHLVRGNEPPSERIVIDDTTRELLK